MSDEFKREPRYIVIKIKDVLAHLSACQLDRLQEIGETVSAGRSADGKPPFNAVVVEQNWPEFEPTWKAIEARMTGRVIEAEVRAEARVADLTREVAQWKNNHATVVRQARVLKERTDMPLERVKAYEHYGEMIERVAELEALNVTKIRLDVVPGDDGMGEEVYARSVADVEQKLSEIDERNEELTSKVAEQSAELERLNAIALGLAQSGVAKREKLAEQSSSLKDLRQLLTDLVEYVETPPERNCSCHISPPCRDCVDNSHLRGLLEDVKTAVAAPKPSPQVTDLRDSYEQVADFSAGNYKGI